YRCPSPRAGCPGAAAVSVATQDPARRLGVWCSHRDAGATQTVQRLVETLAPGRQAVMGVDQLDTDPRPGRGAPPVARGAAVHAQLAADGPGRHVAAAQAEGRITRQHEEPMRAGSRRAIGEAFAGSPMTSPCCTEP